MGLICSKLKGNRLSSTIDTLTDEIATLKMTVSQQDDIIISQNGTIKLLQNKEYQNVCFQNGIVQQAGANILNEIKQVKQNKEYEYLVFSGGGVKGVCYCGALQILDLNGILFDQTTGKLKLKGVAGSSAGSIMASLLAINYSVAELMTIVNTLDFNNILDDKIGVIRDGINFLTDYGVCEGDYMYDLMGKFIKDKKGSADYTIDQLYQDTGIKLVIVATDMNNLKSVYFYPGNTEYPGISIRTAVRASMAIPIVFQPLVINKNYCVDGGVLDNFPLHVFDGEYPGEQKARLNLGIPNTKVLGMNIITAFEQEDYSFTKRREINSIEDYLCSFINIISVENERRLMNPAYADRTISIVTPNYTLTKFSLSEDEKNKLINAGTKYVVDFFEEA